MDKNNNKGFIKFILILLFPLILLFGCYGALNIPLMTEEYSINNIKDNLVGKTYKKKCTNEYLKYLKATNKDEYKMCTKYAESLIFISNDITLISRNDTVMDVCETSITSKTAYNSDKKYYSINGYYMHENGKYLSSEPNLSESDWYYELQNNIISGVRNDKRTFNIDYNTHTQNFIGKTISTSSNGSLWGILDCDARFVITSISYWTWGNSRIVNDLEELTLPKTIEYIRPDAFKNCKNLKTIKVPWSTGKVSGAPWGAPNAKVKYNIK